MTEPALNLNLATRPLRNRRLYATAVRVLGALIVVLAGLSVSAVLKYGGETARLKADIAATNKAQAEASRVEKRLKADITREEKLSRARVNLVIGIIHRKMFSWTLFLSELEKSLPRPSYIMALTPSFMSDGRVAVQMRVMSRSLDDLLAFITALTSHGFKDPKVGGEPRSEDGRLISEISATYVRPL